MPVSREDPGTNFTTDSEIKEVAEETEMMLNEAAAENPVRRKSSLDSNADLFDAVHVDTDGNEDELTEDVRVPRKRRSRQSKKDRAGGKPLDQKNDGKDGCKNDDAEEKRGKERRKKSGRRGKEEETVAPQQNLVEEEMEADLEAMEMGPDEDVNNGTASRRRSKRQLKRRGTFVKHSHEDREAAVQLGVSETKDEPASERSEAEIGGITGEGQPECSGKENNSSGKDASVIAQAEEIRHKVDGSSGKGNSIDPSNRQDKASQLQKEKEDSSGNKSDYSLADMEMTSTALGHISVLESGRDRDVEAMSKGENNFEIGEERAHGQPTSKKSKLPVMKKGKLQDKSKSSRLVKHSSKIPSKARSKKEKRDKMDDRDVAQMSIFDLSVGDSFSHPTPSRLHKPHPQTQPAPDAMASQEARMPEGDGDHNRSVRDSPSSAKTTELLHTHSSEGQENVGKHGVIKRKSRKSKSVVTPRNPEAKKVTSEKALLEELNNLDASYLSEVTNPERRSKIESSLPSRKSSNQKEERESLSDLITRPLVRKSSNKRKLSKMQFFLELEDAEIESRSLSLGKETEKKRSSKVSDMKLTDSCDDYANVPDCKGGQKSLNVTHDVLEDIDPLVSASNAQGKLKPVPRRTTILKSRKRTETSNLNVTFDLDVQSENDCAQMQVTHEPKNVHGDDHSRYSAKVLEECGKKSSNSNKSTEQYLIPSKCFDDELGHDKELTQGVARKTSCDSATENHERVRQDQHAPSPQETSDHQSADAHEAAGRNNMNSSKSKKRRAEDSSTGDREDKPHKVFRTDGVSVSRVMTDVTNTLAAGEESREDEVVRTGGKGDLSAGDAMKENAPEVPQRRARRTKGVVSYKEPSGNKKLRQGDPFTDTVYKSIAPTKVPKA
ncbi:uncharacterized protein [Diadema setosum]|uniref:uncharacterized protein n=1 Tax=Diadema setosum TaxID=31175 RepID=UPI003B3AD6FA